MCPATLHSLLHDSSLTGPVEDRVRGLTVHCVTADSRRVSPGTLFVAVPGSRVDGRTFANEAVERGAIAVATERPESLAGISVPIIPVVDARRFLSHAVSTALGNPGDQLTCIGITGTNGKTSVGWMLAQLLARTSGAAMLIGTLGAGLFDSREGEVADGFDAFEPLANTTPGIEDIHRLLGVAVAARAAAAVCEATSIGIVQYRTANVPWNGAVFTNLTRDHLDIHGSMEAYAEAKKMLFTSELAASGKPDRFAVLNMDDGCFPQFEAAVHALPGVRLLRYSVDNASADVYPLEWTPSLTGTDLRLVLEGEILEFRTRFVGGYNLSNTLAAVAAARGAGLSPAEIGRVFQTIPPVPGRLEVIPVGDIRCVVDYAHTPDGLVQALTSLREITSGRLITVFGCGGDRDRGKRPLMGSAVARLADIAVVTSDNPRTEDPEAIIADVEAGMGSAPHDRLADRRLAIRRALELARPGDTVLLAGKGHETYQVIGTEKQPFDEREIVEGLLRGRQ